ncbi:DUF819 family protein [uncultured Dokdonia sp.]|uniref:DUF819 family protein n=1 Tax=uncultured Dokdonia sp. TaxID=575653 RepID=UPI00262A92F8|nr:DUF819 family protein [uncultured Dokdonia sp.]
MTLLENPVYVLLMLLAMVILAVYAAKTNLGKKLGVALLAILFTAVIANLQLIPSASNSIPLYDGIFTYLAPISIFYLLLGVNLSSIKRAGAPMIILFLIGSLATTLGILISWYVISPQEVLGEDANIIAGMLTGTYTGGSINFNAVALEYDFQKRGVLYAGTIAIDNVVTTVWIIVTLAFPALLRKFWKDKKIHTPKETTKTQEREGINAHSLMWLMFLGLAAYFASDLLATYVPQIPSMITISTLGILLAQVPFVSQLKGSQTLGLYLVYIFLAVIGAYCELSAVVELKDIGLTLLGFTALAVMLHGLFTILFGGLIYRDWDMISIVSQANIGGGTTAIALAETFKRKELLLPAILVGSLGNALGTYLGFMVVYLL